ncbi:MAG: pyridoxal phosphate-dependent aminotransferase [Candidatus Eisenbacteria bacterium]
MKPMISKRISSIGASETLRISAKAKELAAQGIDVIDLSVGEPDFPTPENVKATGKRAIDENITKYTPSPGLLDLRKAIAEKLKRDNAVDYAPDEIIVSSGAKHSLYNVFMAILNEGEEVIVPAPYWVSYPHQVTLAGGKPVILDAREEDGFRLTPGALKAALTEKTKAVIINSPSNPTGAAYSRQELEALCTVAAEVGLVIVADEIYEKLVYDGFRFTSVASLGTAIKEQTVVINGVSKSHAMTGWRLGYAAGPKDIISAMNKVQSHSTSNASSISQMAAIEALRGPQTEVARMVVEFEKRRNYMVREMKRIPGVTLVEPKGAFYVFPNFSAYYGEEYKGTKLQDSWALGDFLMDQAHVAVVPGAAFGNDRCIRLSYATSMEKLEVAVARIIEALGKLRS